MFEQTFRTELPPQAEVMAKIGAIAHQLFKNLPDDGDERQRALLERALLYAAETEQRMANQMERIALLENLSFNDPLTGLLNRRGFTDHLGMILARARRYGEVVKQFNCWHASCISVAVGLRHPARIDTQG